MSKIAVVYWSGTGNTQAMAESVLAGAKESGADLVDDSVMCNGAPDDEEVENCKTLGRALA